jgi:hypothetical protein
MTCTSSSSSSYLHFPLTQWLFHGLDDRRFKVRIREGKRGLPFLERACTGPGAQSACYSMRMDAMLAGAATEEWSHPFSVIQRGGRARVTLYLQSPTSTWLPSQEHLYHYHTYFMASRFSIHPTRLRASSTQTDYGDGISSTFKQSEGQHGNGQWLRRSAQAELVRLPSHDKVYRHSLRSTMNTKVR